MNTGFVVIGSLLGVIAGTLLVGQLPPAPVQSQTFAFSFSDATGAANIFQAHALITGDKTGNRACYAIYWRNSNTIGLVTDAGTDPASTVLVGGKGVLTNSQCSIAAAGVSVTTSGKVLRLTMAVDFSAAFLGDKALMLSTISNAGKASGWFAVGNWSVSSVPPAFSGGPVFTGSLVPAPPAVTPPVVTPPIVKAPPVVVAPPPVVTAPPVVPVAVPTLGAAPLIVSKGPVSLTGVDGLSHSVVRLTFDVAAPFSFARARYARAPAPCVTGLGGVIQPFEKGGTYFTTVHMIVGGLTPSVAFSICPETSIDGRTWTSGTGVTLMMPPLPAVHPALPLPPVTFDTSYPADTLDYFVYTVQKDCSDLGTAYAGAVARQLTQGTLIQLLAGTVCKAGNYQFNLKPLDVQSWVPAAVDVSRSAIKLGGAPALTPGQALIFGRSYVALTSYPVSHSCAGNGLVSGQLFYVGRVLDAATNTATLLCGDKVTPMLFTTQGVDNWHGFYWVPYPRPLKPIILRAATPDSQLPPEHTRLTPAWRSKMASFISPLSNLGELGFKSTVLMFGDDDGNFENMISGLRVGPGVEVTTADSPEAHTASDPKTWYNLIVTYPTTSNVVFDRTYIHGQGTPNRITRGWYWDGLNMGLVDSFLDNLVYFHSEYSGLTATKTGDRTMIIAAGTHNTGTGPIRVAGPRTITLAGTGTGRAFIGLDMTRADAFTVWLPTGLTAACSGGADCATGTVTGTSNATCGNGDAWQKDSDGMTNVGIISCADITNGVITQVVAADARDSVAGSQEGSSFMISGSGPGPHVAINNHIEGAGLIWHHDDGGGDERTRGDLTYIRNEFMAPLKYMYGSNESDGLSYFLRQSFEIKSDRRVDFRANRMNGGWVEVTPASVFVALTSVNGLGITDVDMRFNTFMHGPGVANTGLATAGSTMRQTLPILRFRFENNLAWDIGSPYYWVPRQTNAPTGWILQGPNGAEDITVNQNTLVNNGGRLPTLLWSFDTNTEGVSVTNNIFSIDGQWQGLAQDGSVPANKCSNLRGKALADCIFTPSYVWRNNLMVGNGISKEQAASYWPGLQNDFANSFSDVGFTKYQTPVKALGNPQALDFHVTGQYAGRGADIDALEAAQGKVKDVAVPVAQVTATGAVVTFTAPDGAGCPVDFSRTDPAVIEDFVRVKDAGGARGRSIPLFDLLPATKYFYRINCAVEQPNGSFTTQ